jgi:hypothetical protein
MVFRETIPFVKEAHSEIGRHHCPLALQTRLSRLPCLHHLMPLKCKQQLLHTVEQKSEPKTVRVSKKHPEEFIML